MIFRSLTLAITLVLGLTGWGLMGVYDAEAQIPSRHEVRAQDFVPPGNWIESANGRLDARSGLPRALYSVNYGPLRGTPEDMAWTYLHDNSAYWGLRSDLADLRFSSVMESPLGYHVLFEQIYEGVPCYRSNINVTIERTTSNVVFVISDYKPGLSVPSTRPGLSEAQAYGRAVAHLRASGIEEEYRTIRLMIYAEDENNPRLAYRVTFPSREPFGDWEIFVDAITGGVISVFDRTAYHSPSEGHGERMQVTGSGYVFDPDPLTTAQVWYGTPGYVDPGGGCITDPTTPQLDAARVLVPLKNITFSGGLYRLQGPFVSVTDWDAPTVPVVTATHPDSFRFNREQSGFEDVMVYYHIDSSQRYIQSLGFFNIQNTSIVADPHGANCADNSYYQPSTNRLAWGEGGVDDAEDVDVILHEYGHAIHYGTDPGWGGGESGAIGEGFGDYWARSYGRVVSTWAWQRVFKWDAGTRADSTGQFWPGRRANDPRSYPPGGVGGWQIHDAGQLWSTVLMEIWQDIGREVIDKCVLQSHFMMAGTNRTMRDNAHAVIQANQSLFGGAHVQAMVNRFGARNFVNPAQYIPQITHTPLRDTEDLNGPYPVVATIARGAAGLVPSSIKVHWGRTGAFTDSVLMSPTGIPNQYQALIPGNGLAATYRYYIIVRDSANATATHPAGAPANFHSFYVGLDTVPPVVTHTPLRDQARIRWPARVRATVTDNLGVDSVWVDFIRQRGSLTGSFPLINTTGNTYEGFFTLDTSQVIVGDSIFYKVVARDQSTSGNLATHPSVGFHKFAIISARGVILVVDDDPATVREEVYSEKGMDVRPVSEKGAASRLIARTLDVVGFVVDTVSFATHDPSTYDNYDIVVWSAGARTTSMFMDAGKRAALIARANAGGKIWVEGGEVGWFYRSQTAELDRDFRRRVLHCSTWVSDVTASNLGFLVPDHPIFTMPHGLSAPIGFTGTGFGPRDAMRLIPGDVGARKIAGWVPQFPDTAGIIVFNSLPDPNVGEIVFTSFAVNAITDTTVAKQLTENIAEFLMTPPAGAFISVAPTALNFGPVQLGDSLTLAVRVRNLGSGTLTVTNITNASPRYNVSPRTFSLGPQDTLLVNVTFRPTVVGDVRDTLRFVSNAPSAPIVPLVGRGGVVLLSVMPDSIYFLRYNGSQDTGRVDMTVRNVGTDTLYFTLEEVLPPSAGKGAAARSVTQQPVVEHAKGAPDAASEPLQTEGQGGPDTFGYIWIDSDEPGGPTFNWVDIRPMGTAVTLSDDQNLGPFPLGFTVNFYGNTYNSIRICSNGFLSFTSTSTDFSNTAIPTAAEPNNALYGFWDDLNPATAGGEVHYYADAANNRFIVQFTNVARFNDAASRMTFQMIVKANGEFLYQYLTMTGTTNSATIGIENANGTIALQVVYNAPYVHDNLAVLFTRDLVPWLSTSVTEGVIMPADSVVVQVKAYAYNMTPGNYRARLKLMGNFVGQVFVPVHLEVTSDPVTVSGQQGVPTEFALEQNYPNPFNPTTVIRYALPVEAKVTLRIYNILGQEVMRLADDIVPAGYHNVTWDSRNASGSAVASGVYFYRIDAAPTDGASSFTQIRKMVLVK